MRLAIPNKAWVAWSRAQRTSGRTEAGCIALLCRRWRRTGSRRVRRAALIGTMPRSTQEHPGAPRSKDKEDRAATLGRPGAATQAVGTPYVLMANLQSPPGSHSRSDIPSSKALFVSFNAPDRLQPQRATVKSMEPLNASEGQRGIANDHVLCRRYRTLRTGVPVRDSLPCTKSMQNGVKARRPFRPLVTLCGCTTGLRPLLSASRASARGCIGACRAQTPGLYLARTEQPDLVDRALGRRWDLDAMRENEHPLARVRDRDHRSQIPRLSQALRVLRALATLQAEGAGTRRKP